MISHNTRICLACGLLTLAALMFAGCPSAKRIVLEGYTDDMLNNKRVLVVLPEAADVALSNPVAYASARGTTAGAVSDQLASDLETMIIASLGSYLDSNTVLGYKSQPVSGIVPLNAKSDFTPTDPVNWDAIKRAGREGNIDYLVVLNGMSITNTPSTGRGEEAIKSHFMLIDAQRGKTMTTGNISVDVKEMSAPGDSYQALAHELSMRLPFTAGAGPAMPGK
jgi:hypothetical protein